MEDRIDVTRDGSTATVSVAGELELVQGDKLEAAVRRLLPDVERVVVDLNGVTFMDSSGLGALIALRQAADETGWRFALRGPTQAVTRVLELTSTISLFEIEAPESVPPILT
ncbi:MAG TPA: STAS domain-containing protein [Acidimicrobiales bacterium]|nr:STAS domain-containing protein [Acidimicrobiales bacterium]